MSAWCLAHPWMTFILVAFALLVVDTGITNYLRYRAHRASADKETK